MSIEPWQWQEETWRTMVGRARAGRSLKPASWPQGARCAVAISFDADHETIPLRDNDESPMRISQGHYGARQAMPRIRRLLERESVPATFFYPAVSALLHPNEVRAVAEDGHEIGIHSWIHEVNTALPREAERELTFRARDTLAKISGVEPVGIRTASWDFSVNTLDIIREMKLLYDSSLMADDDPYELEDQGEPTGIVELPPEWIRDDAVYFNMLRFSGLRPYTPPSAVEEIFTAEFDGAWDEGGMFLLTMHPHIIGHRSRLPLLERLIGHIKAKGGCWFAHACPGRGVVPYQRPMTLGRGWCESGALHRGNAAGITTLRKNPIIAAFTCSGRSCWVQCPHPGSMIVSRNLGTTVGRFATMSAAPGNASTKSRSPATYSAGTVTFAPANGARSSQFRSMFRYQFNPPRNPVRANSAA